LPAKPKKTIEYVQIDDTNAILFNKENTEYINQKLREATANPDSKKKIYQKMAKHFAVDDDKINTGIVRYVNKTKSYRGEIPKAGDMKKDLKRLCRKIGHKFVEIRLSHLRGYRECQRCGKVERKYKIKG
jgi:hypothetical protein